MLDVVTFFTAQPGQREALLAAFREITSAVYAEPGCVAYQPFIDAPDLGPIHAKLGRDTLVVLERWESEEALRAHSQAPHIADFLRKTQPILAKLVVQVLTPA